MKKFINSFTSTVTSLGWLVLSGFLLMQSLVPSLVSADADPPPGPPPPPPAGGGGGGFGQLIDLAEQLKVFVDILVVVVITVALLFFFWGLALFILSAGDEEKRAQGKKVMLWGIIALTVIIAIWGLVTFLAETFGINPADNPDALPGVFPAP
jgi:hypothetical protein